LSITPCNWDNRHLLARAMASDFSDAWQFSPREQLIFFVTDQTPRQFPVILLIHHLVGRGYGSFLSRAIVFVPHLKVQAHFLLLPPPVKNFLVCQCLYFSK
jgi:hypothetical protein